MKVSYFLSFTYLLTVSSNAFSSGLHSDPGGLASPLNTHAKETCLSGSKRHHPEKSYMDTVEESDEDGISLGSHDTDEEAASSDDAAYKDGELTPYKQNKLLRRAKEKRAKRLGDKNSFIYAFKNSPMDAVKWLEERAGDDDVIDFSRPEAVRVKRIKAIKGPYHDVSIRDDYSWLEDRGLVSGDKSKRSPYAGDILSILDQERLFAESHVTLSLTDHIAEHLNVLQSTARSTYPIKYGEYLYYSSRPDADSNEIHYRRHIPTNRVDIVMNEATKSKGEAYCLIPNYVVDNNDRLMAYAIDTKGDETYSIRIEDLRTGAQLPDKVQKTGGEFLFNSIGESLIYLGIDDKKTPKTIYHHRVGTTQSADTLLFSESNPEFTLRMALSSDRQFGIIYSGNHSGHDVYLYPLSKEGPQNLIPLTRVADDKLGNCFVDVVGEFVYMVTYGEGSEGELLRLPLATPSLAHKSILVPSIPGKHLLECYPYRDAIALTYLEKAKKTISLIRKKDFRPITTLDFSEAVYDVDVNYTTPDDPFLRFTLTSPLTPPTVLEYEFSTQTVRKRHEEKTVGFVTDNFTTEMRFIDAPDGTKVPVSLFYKKGKLSKKRPLYVTAYGAYGVANLMTYSDYNAYLAEKGVVVAHVHARGGLECGRAWHAAGRHSLKFNTFNDTIAAIEELHKMRIGAPKRTIFEGESAGGLIAGYIANNRPDLVHGILMSNPYLDILNGSLDEEIRLTAGEWSEWGNPRASKDDFSLIKSYCPYNNVKKQEYPNIILTTGLKDTRALYWDALKMAHKIKDTRTDEEGLTLCHVDLFGGHVQDSDEASLSPMVFRLAMITKLLGLSARDV